MRLPEIDYLLPEASIAQRPARPRDASRLLVLHRATGKLDHRRFSDLPEYLLPGDVMVMNDTRVNPARLYGRQEAEPKREVEILLLRRETPDTWQVMLKPGRKIKEGEALILGEGLRARALGRTPEGNRLVQFLPPKGAELEPLLEKIGHPPLPPYITTPVRRASEYQTVYARKKGSIAAPTAGLHFTPRLLAEIKAKATVVKLTLHIGPATFRPVRTEVIENHPMPPEEFILSANAAATINQAKQETRRILAVGTSACRTLETCADEQGRLIAQKGATSLFIKPGYKFRATDVLLTNFHLPKSTNILLVGAFAGLDRILQTYQTAIEEHYRFYSFGDAMLIV
jgi:S-adenosylmethionine:tRNA ribosyltransferase-isomerase